MKVEARGFSEVGSETALWSVDGRTQTEIRLSFREISVLARKVAWLLEEKCGLVKGDRVLVVLPNVKEWWIINLACIRLKVIFGLIAKHDTSFTVQFVFGEFQRGHDGRTDRRNLSYSRFSTIPNW